MVSIRYLFDVAEFACVKSTWLWSVMSLNSTSGAWATAKSPVNITAVMQPTIRERRCKYPIAGPLLMIAPRMGCVSALRHVMSHLFNFAVFLIQASKRFESLLGLFQIG